MTISVRIDEKTHKLLEEYAKKDNRTIGNSADTILLKYLLEWQSINKTREQKHTFEEFA